MLASSARKLSSGASDGGGTDIIVKIVAYGLVVFAILWFVFAVAIPLLMIDIAAIALIASLTRKHLSKWLLILSVGGAVLVVVDYNQGWSTKSLATNVSFLAGLVPILLYLNVIAGLIAAYFLIRNFMDAKSPHPENVGELTKRNVIVMGCLLLIGGLTFGLQTYVDAQRREVRQTVARQVEVTNRQVEAIRIADKSDTRTRIMRQILGEWSASNGSGGPILLTIARTEDGFTGGFTSVIGPEVLSAELQSDNELHLVNERQVGKLVQPGHYFEGDFAQEAWAELSPDGNTLSVRFSREKGGRTLVMHNTSVGAVPSASGTPVGEAEGAESQPTSGSSTNVAAIVIDPPSNIRIAPSASSGIICSVDVKSPITISGSQGNWYKTDACGGKVGYIHRSQIELTNANGTGKASGLEQPTNVPVGYPALVPASGAKPSFDCSKATTPTERLICREGELASAELQMALARNQLARQLTGNEAAAFRAEHLEWFKNWSRTCNSIGKSQPEAELRACIVRFLSTRTQELRARLR